MYWLVLVAAAVILFSAVWILVPAPNSTLLPFGVAAPEVSPVLLAVSLVLVIAASLYARLLGTARLALILSLVSSVLSSWPLVQLPGTLRRFDDEMSKSLRITKASSGVSVARVFEGLRRPRDSSHVIRGVPFTSAEGVPLKLDMYKPVGAGPFPILVQVYGGGWQNGSPIDFEWFSRAFASRGYIVVAIDYRHAPEWKWPAAADDVRAALRWIQQHAKEFSGDAARIVILGRSSGAHLAMLEAYRESSPSIRAVVDLYGPVDLAEGWRHPPQPDPLHVRRVLETFLGGPPAAVADRYRDASPITYVTKHAPPTLLIYGTRDHIVEARFGRQLNRALQAAGATSVLLEIPWAEHAFDIVPNGLGSQIAMHYTERFLTWALRTDVRRP